MNESDDAGSNAPEYPASVGEGHKLMKGDLDLDGARFCDTIGRH